MISKSPDSETRSGAVRLKDADLRILRELQAHPDLTVAEIAERVGMSTSPCWRRIRRLEELGVIRGRAYVFDPSALGLEIVVFASIKMGEHKRDALKRFEKAVTAYPEVTDCYRMTGDFDFLLRIVARNIRAYEAFIVDHLLQLPEVREMHSYIALSTIKSTTALPLGSAIISDDD